jgi:hypothetical protein
MAATPLTVYDGTRSGKPASPKKPSSADERDVEQDGDPGPSVAGERDVDVLGRQGPSQEPDGEGDQPAANLGAPGLRRSSRKRR